MGFFNAIGLIALIGVPMIIILHMLKRKQRDVIIPSTYLWERAADTSVQSKPWQKLKKSLPLILQLVAATALGLAVARPYISAFGTAYNYVIVIDASSSMSAEDMGQTRLEYSKERAGKLIESASALSNITVVAANESPYIVYGPDNDKAEAISAVNSIKQTGGGIDMDTLESIIASEAAKTEAGIYIYTDSESSFKDMDANIFYAGKDTANCAVTLASATEGSVLVNVRNYGQTEETKTITIYSGNMAVAVNDITVPAGNERSLIFKDVYNTSGEISVVMTPEDILPSDDTYYIAVNEAETAKVLLVSDGNTFMENALGLVEGTEIYKMTSETMKTADLTGYDLYIFDGVMPDVVPSDGGLFIINPPEGNSFISTGAVKELNCYSSGASDISGGENLQFIISEAKSVERPSWAVTECSADGVPLIIRGENEGQKVCIFTFDIHNSDLPLLKEFPIMIYNLADWFVPGRIGTQNVTKCGEKLAVDIAADASKVTVENPAGDKRVVAPPFPATDYNDTYQSGFYRVTSEKADGSVTETVLAVNTLTDGESNLSALFGQDKEGTAGKATKGGAALLGILTILAILALIAEWWVKYYGNKRR